MSAHSVRHILQGQGAMYCFARIPGVNLVKHRGSKSSSRRGAPAAASAACALLVHCAATGGDLLQFILGSSIPGLYRF
jgi:hypothetical protein